MWTQSEKAKYDGCSSKDLYYDELNIAVWANLKKSKLAIKIRELQNQLSIIQQNEKLKKDIIEKEKEYDNTGNNEYIAYLISQEDTARKLKELRRENKNLKFQIKTSKILIETTRQQNIELTCNMMNEEDFLFDSEFKIKLELENTIIDLQNKLLKKQNENVKLIKRLKMTKESIENGELTSELKKSQQLLITLKKINIYLRTLKNKTDDEIKNNKKPIQWRKLFFPKCLQKNQNKQKK
jgi:hypothetical protein